MLADLQKLTDMAFWAAVEDVRWRDWTLELVRQFAAPGALFWVIDANRFDMCQNHMCFADRDPDGVAQEYLAEWVTSDPQMTRVCSSRRNEIYLDTEHVDLNDAATSAYVKWQEATVGSYHHITSSVVLSEGLEAGVSLHFTREQGPADQQVREQIASLFPQFSRALQLGYRHAEVVCEHWWDGLSAVDSQPKVLLSEDGKILRFNRAAGAIFSGPMDLRS